VQLVGDFSLAHNHFLKILKNLDLHCCILPATSSSCHSITRTAKSYQLHLQGEQIIPRNTQTDFTRFTCYERNHPGADLSPGSRGGRLFSQSSTTMHEMLLHGGCCVSRKTKL
jgi:hypothetical protein